MLQELLTMRKTLETIEVKGFTNLDRLLGVMMMLNEMIKELQSKEKKNGGDGNVSD